jgi:hypothetical protein
MMLCYVYFGTNDFERAVRFYDATRAPLGMPRCVTKRQRELEIRTSR